MFCENCGSKLNPDVIYCDKCGKKLDNCQQGNISGLKITNNKEKRKLSILTKILIFITATFIINAFLFIIPVIIEKVNQNSKNNIETESVIAENIPPLEEAEESDKKTADNLQDIYIKNISDKISIYSKPGNNGEHISDIENFYTTMYYYGESEPYASDNGITYEWYKIYINNEKEGYVRSDLVVSQNANQEYAYASDNEGGDYLKYYNGNINIYKEPSFDSEIAGTITDCKTLIHSCYGEEGTTTDTNNILWKKVIVNSDVQGWVCSDVIMTTSADAWCDAIFIKNVSGNLNMRARATHNSDLVATITSYDVDMYYHGNSAKGLGSDGVIHKWYEVYISKDIKGWVREDLVKPKE